MYGRKYKIRTLIMYRTLLHLDEAKHKWTWGKESRLATIPYEHLAQRPSRFSILELLSIGQLKRKKKLSRGSGGGRTELADLKIHIAVRADEEPLVFETPLEANEYRLPGELL